MIELTASKQYNCEMVGILITNITAEMQLKMTGRTFGFTSGVMSTLSLSWVLCHGAQRGLMGVENGIRSERKSECLCCSLAVLCVIILAALQVIFQNVVLQSYFKYPDYFNVECETKLVVVAYHCYQSSSLFSVIKY